MEHPTSYRTIQIDGLSIFYREAGPKDAPVLLLLHGLPSSSRMFEPLFARLSDRYRLVAPDYPGFGHSDWPAPKKFAYTFDHYAEIMNHFTEVLGLSRYTLYMQDYGGPVGFRMALAHPVRIEALIVQDAVAHNEGLGANWKPRRAFWAHRAANESTLRTNLLSLPTTRTRHLGNDPNVDRYDPDLWTDEFAFLSQPGQADIQSDLFYDYRTNVGAYPKWQAWMREKQPRLLVLWGKHDLSFELSEPEAYRRDVPKAEVHVLDAGHFALDTAADQIAQIVRGFMNGGGQGKKIRKVAGAGRWRPLRGLRTAGALCGRSPRGISIAPQLKEEPFMKRIAFLLLAVATLAGVVAFTPPASLHADEGAAPVFVTQIPPGYRDWRLISVAHEEGNLNSFAAVLGNDVAIKAYREGKLPFPDGAVIAALHYGHVPSEENNKVFGRSQSFVAAAATNIQFMVKDSKKYATTGGWGFAHFKDGKPGDDAFMKTCFPCHNQAKARDLVFTQYAP